MTGRQFNLALWTAAILLACGALFTFLGGLFVPLSAPENQATAPSQVTRIDGASSAHTTQLSLLDRPLRASLTDSTTPSAQGAASVMPASPSGPSSLVLVGTIGDSLAMIRAPDGSVSLKGIGDQIDGANVTAIEPMKIELSKNGRPVTLRKPLPGQTQPVH